MNEVQKRQHMRDILINKYEINFEQYVDVYHAWANHANIYDERALERLEHSLAEQKRVREKKEELEIQKKAKRRRREERRERREEKREEKRLRVKYKAQFGKNYRWRKEKPTALEELRLIPFPEPLVLTQEVSESESDEEFGVKPLNEFSVTREEFDEYRTWQRFGGSKPTWFMNDDEKAMEIMSKYAQLAARYPEFHSQEY